ncbi:RNA-binding protein MEX3B-like [Antedon mediterranea]|uniref:RNA-binding protein MEX3B-like n=1 Tax=Antedon mediterranea TaxID=105859 RepID=UPI003AF4FE38
MPSTIITEMDRNSTNSLDEHQRNLGMQSLALDFSMLNMAQQNGNLSGGEDDVSFDGINRKSCNMTECVPVPSSEHVAEIVGRQGCKIKALRAKTNTYIKTPVRGEEPVFVVTGRKEDVAAAKREILSAAEHFSQIRASRRNQQGTAPTNGHSTTGLSQGQPPPNIPGQITIQVRVPYRVVGLVVGPKGATIKRIQQQTHTYIVTPSRDNEPVFEVTGMPENTERAREEIEAHIAMRTGGLVDSIIPEDNDFATNGKDSGILLSELGSVGLFKGTGNSAFTPLIGNAKAGLSRNSSSSSDSGMFFPTSTSSTTTLTDFPATKTIEFSSTKEFNNSYPFGLFDCQSPDLGIDSPGFDPLVGNPWHDLNRCSNALFGGLISNSNPNGMRRKSSGSLGITNLQVNEGNDHPPARRIHSDPLDGGLTSLPAFNAIPMPPSFSTSNSTGSNSASTSPTNSTGSSNSQRKPKECYVCSENEVVAALVPCGHNLFCMDCAKQVLDKLPAECPVCFQQVNQAIRIIS